MQRSNVRDRPVFYIAAWSLDLYCPRFPSIGTKYSTTLRIPRRFSRTSHSCRKVHRAAVLRNIKAVLEAHADLALDIHPRLVRESMSYLEDDLAPAVQVWILMDLQADPMSKAVCKILCISRKSEEESRGFVDTLGDHTRMGGLKGDILSRVDKVPYLKMGIWNGGNGKGECAGDVAPVAVQGEQGKVTGVKATVGAASMRKGGVFWAG